VSAKEYLIHTTGPADRWDSLADLYYGDPTRYEPIARENLNLGFPAILPANVKVRIPILEEETTTDASPLPPWRIS
jgi:hypothetical protein